MPQSFWQKLSASQNPDDDDMGNLLASLGQRNASPADISALDSAPVAPIDGADRSPAGAFYPTPNGAPPPAPVRRPPPVKPKPVAKTSQSSQTPPGSAPFDLNDPYPGVLRGHFLDQMHEDQLKNSEQQSRTFFMDPEVQKERIQELSQIPQFAALAQSNQNYKDAIGMAAQRPAPVNYSSLLGMADVMSNGKYNLQAKYTPPNSGDARQKELLDSLDKAQDNDRQTAQTLTNLSSSGKAGNDIMTAASMLLNKNNDGFKDFAKRFGVGGNAAVSNNLRFDSENEKIMKPYQDAQNQIDKSLGLLNNNASVSDIAATLQFVKPMVSRLTNFEWSKLGRGATDAENRFKQAFSTLDSGTLTDDNRGQYRNALSTLRDINDEIAEQAQQQRVKIGTAAGLDPSFSNTSSRGHYTRGTKKTSDPASPSPSTDPLRDAALQEIARRKAQGK